MAHETDPREAAPSADTAATAREEFHCPACGAEAHWNPGRQALVCPFCGTESPADLTTAASGEAAVLEHDLAAALAAMSDDARGWQAAKTSVRCQSCRAISVFDPDRVGQRCEFCGSSSLVPYEEVPDAFRPESLLPLRVSESQARDRIRQWYGRLWLAPNHFSSRALTDTVHGIYLPYWTFDAQVDARWTAESGDYYYVQRGGKRVRQVRWRRVAGDLSHWFDDDLVPASRGVHPERLRAVEPFPTDTLVPYDAGYLAGWTVERYQIDLVAAARRSRERMTAEMRAMCAARVPGDTHRQLMVDTRFSRQTFKHILAPVWFLSYTHGSRSYQAVVNGVTGAVAGDRPYSWIKILALVLVVLTVLLLLALVDR